MNINGYIPPYHCSDTIVIKVSKISELLTRIRNISDMDKNPKLRRENRIKTIHASLSIENNSLSLSQITDIINGRRILGPLDEICEVKNAFEAYNQLLELDPFSLNDLLYAHQLLMSNLVNEAGSFRQGGVGIYKEQQLVHMAPPAKFVPNLIIELLEWTKTAEVHPLIMSCVFHYEFEFIHPFADGNGRMGRMWQTLLLYQWNPMFGWLPIETIIKERQHEYYKVLGDCDREGDSSLFIDFMLQAIVDTLLEFEDTVQVSVQVSVQVDKLISVMKEKEYSTKELMELVGIKHRPTFRKNYLLPAIQEGLIVMCIPDKPNSSKQKYKRK